MNSIPEEIQPWVSTMTVLRGLIKAMRPRQWSKNFVLLAAVIFDRQLSLRNPTPLIHTLLGLLLFCLLSSSVYIINDLMDIEADRQHPKKRYRPIASGQLPRPVAIAAAVLMVLATFPLAYLLSPTFAWICLAYFLLNLAYTFRLKHVPLLDVLILAAFYLLRVAAGASIIVVQRFSPWLYVVTFLGSLYLGFGKRRAELNLLADEANAHRRVLEGYTIPFLDQLISIAVGTTIIAYSLYTFSAPNLPENHVMMLTIPFVAYGMFRSLYLIQVQEAGGAPEELFLTDRPLQITILLYGLVVFAIFYLIPLFS